jgi:uncharacterized membrane protein YqjE
METQTPASSEPGTGKILKRLAHRVLIVCENRFQLLLVEVQEERERFLRAIWLGVAAVAFGLLAGIALTLVVAVAFWNHSPVVALLALAAVYVIIALLFYARLVRMQRDWQTLSATIEQLRKDRECLEKQMA